MESCGRVSPAQYLWGVFFIAGSLTSGIVLRQFEHLTVATTTALVLVPIFAGVFYLWLMVRDLSRLDELQRRFWTEGAVAGCGGTFILLMTYPLLERAGWVGPMNPPVLAGALSLFVAAGFLRAWSRYR